MRQPVARRELAQAARVGREPRADDREAGAEADEQLAPQQVGAEHEIGEPAVRQDQRAQALHGHDQHLAGLHDHGAVERVLAGQQAELAEEAARPVDRDDPLVALPELVDDGHQALQDDEEVVAVVALVEQDLPRLDAAPLALGLQPCELLLAEARICAVAVGRLGELFGRVEHRVDSPVDRPGRRARPRHAGARARPGTGVATGRAAKRRALSP